MLLRVIYSVCMSHAMLCQTNRKLKFSVVKYHTKSGFLPAYKSNIYCSLAESFTTIFSEKHRWWHLSPWKSTWLLNNWEEKVLGRAILAEFLLIMAQTENNSAWAKWKFWQCLTLRKYNPAPNVEKQSICEQCHSMRMLYIHSLKFILPDD